MNSLDDTYRSWLLANPKAFVEGVRGFCKTAAQRRIMIVGGDNDESEPETEKSLWDTIKPWIIGLGGGYLALKAGERWGRFAQKHNYKYGPILGPALAGLNAVLPERYNVQGTLTRDQANAPNNGQAYF